MLHVQSDTPGWLMAGFDQETSGKPALARHLLRAALVMATVRDSLRLRSSALALNAATSRSMTHGFTLVELMVVVAIMGVLATLATYGVRKYLLEAKKAEAASMITQIRAAEEAYRDETFRYLGSADDTFDVWHPLSNPGAAKYDWGTTTSMRTVVFDPLGVRPTGAVQYAYGVVAGAAGDDIPTIPTTRVFGFPEPTGPFYIVMAKADLNGDGTFTYALSHSDTSEIYFDQTF
jgi:prepilin-type N-terminal cleavage/methylation domain-containing protein